MGTLMIVNKVHLCTKLEVWSPKYAGRWLEEYGEPVALVHKRKVDFGSPILIVDFPKAKSLAGQRFAIKKLDAQRHKVGTNGKADMYEIPLSHFEYWESSSEVLNIIEEIVWPEPNLVV